jgi:hypothetical protein
MAAIGNTRHRALRVATLGMGCVAAAAVFIPHVMGAAGDSAAALPLGVRAPVSALASAPQASPPEGLRVLAAQTGEADLATTRILAAASDQALYATDSLKGADRFCLAATGAAVGLWCGPREAVGSGKLIIRQPLKGGGPGTPAVYFGVVPDGVVSVSAGATRVAVKGNAFSVYDEGGDLLPRLTYASADGSTVTVDPLSAD